MKNLFKLALVTVSVLGLTSGAMAAPFIFTVDDDSNSSEFGGWNNWNNDDTLNDTLKNVDVHGTPIVNTMNVHYDDESNLLTKIEIILGSSIRQTFDSLFINTNYTDASSSDDWQDWDYYVLAGANDNKDNVSPAIPGNDGLYGHKAFLAFSYCDLQSK